MKLLNTFHISSNAILLLGAAEKKEENSVTVQVLTHYQHLCCR